MRCAGLLTVVLFATAACAPGGQLTGGLARASVRDWAEFPCPQHGKSAQSAQILDRAEFPCPRSSR